MQDSPPQSGDASPIAPSKSTLVMAVATPFAVIALLAAPLFVDTLKAALGL
jgi:hypothetical protein